MKDSEVLELWYDLIWATDKLLSGEGLLPTLEKLTNLNEEERNQLSDFILMGIRDASNSEKRVKEFKNLFVTWRNLYTKLELALGTLCEYQNNILGWVGNQLQAYYLEQFEKFIFAPAQSEFVINMMKERNFEKCSKEDVDAWVKEDVTKYMNKDIA